VDELDDLETFATDLDAQTRKVEADVDASLPEVVAAVMLFLSGVLQFGGPGGALTLAQQTANATALLLYRARLRDIVLQTALGRVLNSWLDGLGVLTETVETYYVRVGAGYVVPPATRALVRGSIEATRAALLGAELDTAIVNPIVRVLQQQALTGGSLGQMTAALERELTAASRPVRYVKQLMSDGAHMLVRQYANRLGDEIGLDHYYYAGTLIVTSRAFCKSRVGRAYTKKEVEAWAGLDWEGKISWTDKRSIFTLLGGYNCRHQLRPITKSLFSKIKTKPENGIRTL
jgi:hypothetical protein